MWPPSQVVAKLIEQLNKSERKLDAYAREAWDLISAYVPEEEKAPWVGRMLKIDNRGA